MKLDIKLFLDIHDPSFRMMDVKVFIQINRLRIYKR